MITKWGDRITRTDPHRHKYDCAVCNWVYDHLDEYLNRDTGSAEAPMGNVIIAGKRLIFTDERGFVSCDKYPSVHSAEQVFYAMELWYSLWEFGDEPDPPFVYSLDDCQRYTMYVVACASENLEARPFDVWFEFDQPKGPLG